MPASYILTFGGTEPNPFSFSKEAAVVSLALLGDGREPAVIQPCQLGQAWFTQKKSIYPGVPRTPAYLLSTKYEYRANNTWAVTRFQLVNLSSAEQLSLMACETRPTSQSPRTGAEWAQSGWRTILSSLRFQVPWQYTIVSVSRLCGPCGHPGKANQLKLGRRPFHNSLLPYDIGPWVLIAKHFPVICHLLQ